MTKQTYEQQPLPKDLITYTTLRVSGVNNYQTQASKAIAATNTPALFIQLNPANPHDKYAIKVMVKVEKSGIFALFNKDTHIGHIPKQMARILYKHDVKDKITIRIKSIYREGKAGKITSVIIDLIGPEQFYTDKLRKEINSCDL